MKLYNPRFEEEFVAGKDFDPDRCGLATPCTTLHTIICTIIYERACMCSMSGPCLDQGRQITPAETHSR